MAIGEAVVIVAFFVVSLNFVHINGFMLKQSRCLDIAGGRLQSSSERQNIETWASIKQERLFSPISGNICPGYSSSNPRPMTASTKDDIIKVVVSGLIVYLTLAQKVNEIRNSLSRKLEMQEGAVIEKNEIFDEGVVITDTTVGSVEIKEGDIVLVDISLFFNGFEFLKLDSQRHEFVSEEKFQELFAVALPDPLKGLAGTLSNMRFTDSERKFLVSPKRAFGDEGYPPFVPPGATVTLRARLRRPKSS